MVDSGIRTRHLRLLNRDDTPHMYCTRHQLCRLELCASWAISGKGKEAPTTELNIFLSKNFSTENKTSKVYVHLTFRLSPSSIKWLLHCFRKKCMTMFIEIVLKTAGIFREHLFQELRQYFDQSSANVLHFELFLQPSLRLKPAVSDRSRSSSTIDFL